jgi:hypothetical protein
MKNLYSLHSNPEQLFGYDQAKYRIPIVVYELAKKKPKLRKQLEPVIMKDPEWAYFYARDVRKRPWPEAEPVIMTNPRWAYNYALGILKRPWPEAEPYIMKYSYWWNAYLDFKHRYDIYRDAKLSIIKK